MISVAITTVDGAPSGRPGTVAVGATVNVAAEITYENGTTESKLTDDPRLTWTSGDTSKATVTGGAITGIAVTDTNETIPITVSADGTTSTPINITVTSVG